MEINKEELLQAREKDLAYYSPYTFIRKIELPEQFSLFVQPTIEKFGTVDSCKQLVVTAEGMPFVFLYEYLAWDSQHFSRPFYKLFTVLYKGQPASALIKAIGVFKSTLQQQKNCYCFAEIPAEDIFLIQCLNEAGMRMVETRLHYFKSNLENFTTERYSVREATQDDIPNLSKVAAISRNDYDRMHADYAFSVQQADDYLSAYAKAAVQGFCDHVFVPHVENLPIASFIAFDYYPIISNRCKLSLLHPKIAAVSAENRGWYVKLLSETMHYARERQVSYIKLTTQLTNKKVITAFEKLDCNFGAASHILSFNF